MALDTDTRKFSAVNLSSPWRGIGAIPSGALDEEEWFSVVHLYNEFAAAGPSPEPPTLLGQIPNLSAAFDSGTHQYDLSQYFANADTYAIDPAVETGWSFDTNTGILTIDTDVEDTFGPFTVTATNGNGDTDSNAFSFTVSVPSTGSHRRSMYVPSKKYRKSKPQTAQSLISRITRILK